MAFDTSQLADYSWPDIAKAAKTAMLSAALGGTVMRVNGRELGRITIDQARALYDYAIEQLAIEQNGEYGTDVLVNINEPQ